MSGSPLADLLVTVEPSLPDVLVIVGPLLPDIAVALGPASPDVSVGFSEVGLAGATGPVGPAGPVGVVGATGPPGSSYTHTQTAPAASWTVQHNLGVIKYPVIILDGQTEPVLTDTVYPDLNTIVLIFPAPAFGKAYI